MQQTEYKTSNVTIRVIESNIFHNYVHEHATVTVKNILEVKNINLNLSNGEPYALLISKGEFSIVPPKVRELVSSNKFVGNTVAKALLSRCVADKIIGQFYIKINKPAIKTKLFTNKEKAISWLKQEISQHSIDKEVKNNKLELTI